MKKLFKYFWQDKPSLLLWVFTLLLLFDTAANNANHSYFLALFLGVIIYYVRERGKFMDLLNQEITNPLVRHKLGLNIVWGAGNNSKITKFGIVVSILIICGALSIIAAEIIQIVKGG